MNLHSQELGWKPKLFAPAREWPCDESYSLSFYQWSSNEKSTSASELRQWDGSCGIVAVLWGWVIIVKVLEKGSGRYSNSHFADAPVKQQYLQLVSHLLIRGVRNKNKDSYGPSQLILSKFVLWWGINGRHTGSENHMDLIHPAYHQGDWISSACISLMVCQFWILRIWWNCYDKRKEIKLQRWSLRAYTCPMIIPELTLKV